VLLNRFLPLALWVAIVFIITRPLAASAKNSFFGASHSRDIWKVLLFALLFLALFAWRAPILFYPGELNPDESSFIAQALGYARHWLPFSQDGVTSGPLNSYVLMWPMLAGKPLSYLTIRLTGLVCVFITLVFSIKTLSAIVGENRSLPLALPLIAFYLFAYRPDFVHYSSEHLPVALFAISLWLTTVLWKHMNGRAAFVLGIILGAIPFSKLQAAPLAVYLFFVALGLIWSKKGKSGDKQTAARTLACLVTGTASTPLFLGIVVIANGMLGDVFQRYIVSPWHYGTNIRWYQIGTHVHMAIQLLKHGLEFTIYFLGMLICAGLGVALLGLARMKRITRSWWVGFILIFGYFFLAWWVVLKPNLAFIHYLLLLPVPTLLVIAWIVRGGVLFLDRGLIRRFQPWAAVLPVALSLLPIPIRLVWFSTNPRIVEIKRGVTVKPFDPVSEYIRKVTAPGDCLAVWGWTPKYYVETQLPPATCDVIAYYDILSYDYYRAAYLKDLKRTMPRVFVDSAGEMEWGQPLELSRAVNYPPLARFLADNYRLAVEITTPVDPEPGSVPAKPPVLIYLRKD